MAMRIDTLERASDEDLQQLADVLLDCVEGGASVSFMHPLSREKALAFWRRCMEGAQRGERVVFVSRDAQGIVGTVQLVMDLPENQPHRADIAKMLVHRRGRRQGIGAALMQAAEREAQRLRRNLLVLDTANDEAQRVYARLGWRLCGVIPNYALLPQGGLCATTYMYRELASEPRP